jgi:hypothetical protein
MVWRPPYNSGWSAIDSYRQVLATTRAIVAEWAARNNGTRDVVAASILELLAPCYRDNNGDKTLDAVDPVFEEHGETLPPRVIQRLADLADAAHVIGRYRNVRLAQ